MKLRNKKTGKIYDLCPIMRVREIGTSRLKYIPIKSLKDLRKEWEDYKEMKND